MLTFGIPDEFVEQGKVPQLHHMLGIDSCGMAVAFARNTRSCRRGEEKLRSRVRRNLKKPKTEENPLGVYHPHAEYHHIKKENIGLIEVMGLAVLPED